MSATFVGFGFGPIQTGLLLFEAVESGRFDRFVVAEVDQVLVDAVRAAGDEVAINIAGKDGIHTRRLSSIELFNPHVAAGQGGGRIRDRGVRRAGHGNPQRGLLFGRRQRLDRRDARAGGSIRPPAHRLHC